MLDKKTLRLLYVTLGLCLVIRVGLTIYLQDTDIPREARANVRIGQCIADGRGFAIDQSFGDSDPTNGFHLTAYRNPIYPAFLGAIFATVGEGQIAVGIVQSIVDTLTCLLIFLFAFRTLGRPKAALAAAVMYALYPPAIAAATLPMPETLATLSLLLASYRLVKAMGGETGGYVAAGAMLGLLILLRPVMALFPLAALLIMLAGRRRLQGWLVKSVVYACAACVVVSPWIIRNYRVFHTFIPVNAQAGNSLWGGTGPADGKSMVLWSYPVESIGARKVPGLKPILVNPETYLKISDLQDRLSGMKEPDIDASLLTEAADEIRQHPGRYGFLAAKKFVRMWFNLWDDAPAGFWTWAMAAINAVLFILAIVGYRRPKTDYRLRLVSLYTLAYVTIVSIPLYCNVRCSYPLIPLVIVLAASQVATAFDAGSSRGRIVIDI